MPDEIQPPAAGDAQIAGPASPINTQLADYVISGPAQQAAYFVPQQNCAAFSNVGVASGTLSDVQITSNPTTVATDRVSTPTNNPVAPADGQLERHAASVVATTDRSTANLVISTNESGQTVHTWQKEPNAADNYQCKVFVDDSVRNNANAIHSELEKAKTEISAKGIDLQVPSTDKLPSFSQEGSTAAKEETEKEDPEEKTPNPPGGGGGGGGGCQPKTPEDKEDSEDSEKENESDKDSKTTDNSSSRNILDETKRQLDLNGGISFANLASYAGGLWGGSMLSNLFSQYDRNGDGKLDADEMAAMKADPKYQTAIDEMKNKIGDNPALKDFKDKLDSAEGLSNLHNLQKAGANATAADVNKVFNTDARTAISKIAVSQQLAAAQVKGTDSMPTDPAKQQEMVKAMKTIVDKLINGTHTFTF